MGVGEMETEFPPTMQSGIHFSVLLRIPPEAPSWPLAWFPVPVPDLQTSFSPLGGMVTKQLWTFALSHHSKQQTVAEAAFKPGHALDIYIGVHWNYNAQSMHSRRRV